MSSTNDKEKSPTTNQTSTMTTRNSRRQLAECKESSNNEQLMKPPAAIRKIASSQTVSKLTRSEIMERTTSFNNDDSHNKATALARLPPQYSVDNTTNSGTKKRTRTMYAPVQMNTYGPKATLKKVTEDSLLLIQDPLSQQLLWKKPPVYVLVIKKICNTLIEPFIELIKYLLFNHNMIVYIEENEYEHEQLKRDQKIKNLIALTSLSSNGPTMSNGSSKKEQRPALRKFIPCSKILSHPCNQQSPLAKLNHLQNQVENCSSKIDLIICVGGDGTLLHVSTQFQKSCPPVLSLNMGSLGFLCPFDFENYKEYVDGVIKGNVPLLVRNRLSCRLEKSPECNGVSCVLSDSLTDLDFDCNNHIEWLSLNEVVVDRGSSPFLSNLDLYINDVIVTTVQGDGLIISSPTGSTAYAMAAGASMCHPSVPAIIIVPICPHSLSFRPIVVPAGVELRIALSADARHTASYSIDGRNSGELKQGYQLRITTSEFPLPSICRSDQMNDWFEGLGMCLHWNQRQKQLPLNACYLNTANLHNGHANNGSLSSSKSSSTSSLLQLSSSSTTGSVTHDSPNQVENHHRKHSPDDSESPEEDQSTTKKSKSDTVGIEKPPKKVQSKFF